MHRSSPPIRIVMSRGTGSPLRVVNALQFSVLQLPLSLTALGLYIRDTQCGPFARRSQASPPQPFCTAPIVLAAVIVLVEVCAHAVISNWSFVPHPKSLNFMSLKALCRHMLPCLSWLGPILCSTPETCCKTSTFCPKYGLSSGAWYCNVTGSCLSDGALHHSDL